MDANIFKNIPPKTWAIAGVGGVGLGLYWRKRTKGSATVPTSPGTVATPSDLTGFALAGSSTGPFAGYSGTGGYGTDSGAFTGTSPTATGNGTTQGVPTLPVDTITSIVPTAPAPAQPIPVTQAPAPIAQPHVFTPTQLLKDTNGNPAVWAYDPISNQRQWVQNPATAQAQWGANWEQLVQHIQGASGVGSVIGTDYAYQG